MKRITPKQLKDGIPLCMEQQYNEYFKLENRYDKMKNINEMKLGKRISYLLRHNSESLIMDKNGWIYVSDLLEYVSITKDVLDSIVMNNDKKRFSYNDDETKIRANQGHSLEVDVQLEKKIPPTLLYHGTSPEYVKSILKNGLSKMKRNHVHLSIDNETAIIVGKRHSKHNDPIVFVIDTKEMVKDKVEFFLSKNNVWLTEYVHPKYISIWD